MNWKWLTAVAIVALIAASVAFALFGDSDEPLRDVTGVDRSGIDGAQVFATSCARCHGADLRGTASGPPLLDTIYRPAHHPDAAFITAIRIGSPQHHWPFGAMAPIEGLSDAQIAALIAFIREQQRAVGIE